MQRVTRNQNRSSPLLLLFFLTTLHYTNFSPATPQVSAILYCKISILTFLTNLPNSLTTRSFPCLHFLHHFLTRFPPSLVPNLVPTLLDLQRILCYIKKKKLRTQKSDPKPKSLRSNNMICKCSEPIDPRRVALGYHTCPVCGDLEARKVVRCVAPLNKSNYVLVSNYTELKMLNPKCINA